MQEEQKTKVYRCPNDCTVSDESKRCPRCGQWLKYDGQRTKAEIIAKTEGISSSHIPSTI